MRRKGIAGFVGGSIYWIKGFFKTSHSVTSVSADQPSQTIGFISIIQSTGKGVLSSMSSDGAGILSAIEQSNGFLSIIQSNGKGVSSAIEETGKGVDSK